MSPNTLQPWHTCWNQMAFGLTLVYSSLFTLQSSIFIPSSGATFLIIGPLLYHYSGTAGEISIELSLEEIKQLATKFGFEFLVCNFSSHFLIQFTASHPFCYSFPLFLTQNLTLFLQHEEKVDATYCRDVRSMQHTTYCCSFFICRYDPSQNTLKHLSEIPSLPTSDSPSTPEE